MMMPERRAAMLKIADQIRDARLAAGLTQHELADRAEVSRPSVARVERGDDVSTATLGKITDHLGLTLKLTTES